MLLTPAEPAPFELINANGSSAVVLVCDHASNRVPHALQNLGLDREQLLSHIAWDPGAAMVARKLSALLDAPLCLSNYSRLVIDCNRRPGKSDSIPATSAGVAIAGNTQITGEAALQRRQELFDPYQGAIAQLLDGRASRPTQLLSIHSFTPHLNDEDRPWLIGVCYRRYGELAKQWSQALVKRVDGPVGDNQPYSIEEAADYTLPVQGESRNIPSIMLELRQDAITTPADAEKWAEIIAEAWREIEQGVVDEFNGKKSSESDLTN